MQLVELAGEQFVIIPLIEYERLCGTAGESIRMDDDSLPELPKPDRKGYFPAAEYLRASIAREIIQRRRQLRLAQFELARLAKLTPETLSRIESGRHTAAGKTIDRIHAALDKAEKRKQKN